MRAAFGNGLKAAPLVAQIGARKTMPKSLKILEP
jgi:hypothetical protein